MTVAAFQTGLWAETWRVARINLRKVVIYVAAMIIIAALPEFLDGKGGSGFWVAQTFAAVLLAIPAHLTVLRNSPVIDATANRVFLDFWWRGLILSVLPFIPCAVLALVMIWSWGAHEVIAGGVSLLLWLILGSAAFAKWGTVLPAVITDCDKTYSAAGARGSQTFGYAFGRLLVSLGLLTAIQFGASFTMLMVFNSSGDFFTASGGIDILTWLIGLVSQLIGAYGLIMTAVILSRSLLLAENNTTL